VSLYGNEEFRISTAPPGPYTIFAQQLGNVSLRM
jgi:hypothetical protein